MALTREYLRVEDSDAPGLTSVVEYGDWCVGIKKHRLANDKEGFVCLEKHLETDEVFILLTGHCVLLIKDGQGEIQLCPLEKYKVYCVPKGVWHNTVVSRDVKMILVEGRDTTMENTELQDLQPRQLSDLRAAAAKYF